MTHLSGLARFGIAKASKALPRASGYFEGLNLRNWIAGLSSLRHSSKRNQRLTQVLNLSNWLTNYLKKELKWALPTAAQIFQVSVRTMTFRLLPTRLRGHN